MTDGLGERASVGMGMGDVRAHGFNTLRTALLKQVAAGRAPNCFSPPFNSLLLFAWAPWVWFMFRMVFRWYQLVSVGLVVLRMTSLSCTCGQECIYMRHREFVMMPETFNLKTTVDNGCVLNP